MLGLPIIELFSSNVKLHFVAIMPLLLHWAVQILSLCLNMVEIPCVLQASVAYRPPLGI